MKKTFAILLAVMMLVTLFPMVTAEEAIDVIPAESIPEENVEIEIPAEDPEIEIPAAEEPAAEETDDEEPVAEEPAQEEPVAEEPAAEEPAQEEPAAEEPAQEEPVQEETVAEEPAAEEPAVVEAVEDEQPAVEEPTEEAPAAEEVPAVEEAIEEVPAVEEPVTVEDVQEEVPAVEEPVIEEAAAEEIPAVEETVVEEIPAVEEPVAEEIPAVEEEAAPVFTGTIAVVLVGSSDVEIGQYVTMHAIVENANMAYSIQWQKRNPASEDKWTNIENETDEYYIIIATESAGNFIYRAILVAEDGTIAIAVYPISLNIIIPEEETVEEGIPAAEEKITQEEPEQTESQEEEIIDELNLEDVEFETEEILEIEEYNTALGMSNYQTITLEEDDEEFADVDVREDADGLSVIFTSLPAGTTLTVVGIEGDWAHVVVDGQEGYIYIDDLADYIDVSEETEEPAEEEDPRANMKVTVFSSRRASMCVGENVRLTSKIEGFEGYTVRYQWECDKRDGAGFQEIAGANGSEYDFSASAESLCWDWRLSVYFE